jgi:hypothetical protein
MLLVRPTMTHVLESRFAVRALLRQSDGTCAWAETPSPSSTAGSTHRAAARRRLVRPRRRYRDRRLPSAGRLGRRARVRRRGRGGGGRRAVRTARRPVCVPFQASCGVCGTCRRAVRTAASRCRRCPCTGCAVSPDGTSGARSPTWSECRSPTRCCCPFRPVSRPRQRPPRATTCPTRGALSARTSAAGPAGPTGSASWCSAACRSACTPRRSPLPSAPRSTTSTRTRGTAPPPSDSARRSTRTSPAGRSTR